MDWIQEFYHKQDEWSGVYTGAVDDQHHAKVARFANLSRKRILELGAGGGQHAVACAELGHDVTAIELVPRLAAHARQLAAMVDCMAVIEGDFYIVTLDDTFDIICYWDGFGVGTDDDQRRLLQRVQQWLKPDGMVILDVFTPWYAANSVQREMTFTTPNGALKRRYDFDADGCRWVDQWWPVANEVESGEAATVITQSLRCYSPADLRLLLADTGLQLIEVEAGGAVDWHAGVYHERVPLAEAMFFVATLTHV